MLLGSAGRFLKKRANCLSKSVAFSNWLHRSRRELECRMKPSLKPKSLRSVTKSPHNAALMIRHGVVVVAQERRVGGRRSRPQSLRCMIIIRCVALRESSTQLRCDLRPPLSGESRVTSLPSIITCCLRLANVQCQGQIYFNDKVLMATLRRILLALLMATLCQNLRVPLSTSCAYDTRKTRSTPERTAMSR